MIDAPPMLRETLMGWPRHVSLPLAPLLVLAFATVTLGVLMTTPGSTQDTAKLRLGTATPGGGFPVYGAAFIAAVQGADAGLAIEAVNTKGSTENVPMLEEKRLDIALVQGEVVHEVLSGVGRPPAKLKIITAMYSTPGMFVVRADSPYRTIADLEGKPVAFGAAGSGLVILARYVLDGLGLDQNKDFQAIYLERAGDGPAMVMDGRAAALWGGGSGWPRCTPVCGAICGRWGCSNEVWDLTRQRKCVGLGRCDFLLQCRDKSRIASDGNTCPEFNVRLKRESCSICSVQRRFTFLDGSAS